MQSENISEYKLLRDEMVTVKDCITKYIGYVLGGSGAAIYGMARKGIIPANSSNDFTEIAVTSLALSVIISFVLLILFYKFNSHNRFAGYCKLLNHERYNPQPEGTSFLSWELVLERLRFYDISPKSLPDLVKSTNIRGLDKDSDKKSLAELLGKYTGKRPKCDRYKFLKGLVLLVKAFFGKVDTRSWGFPPIVAALLFVLSFSFFCFAQAILWPTLDCMQLFSRAYFIKTMLFIYILFFSAIYLLLWYRFIGNLYSLMKGSSTVDGFFWKFLPVRVSFLKSYQITPEYLFVRERLLEALKELQIPNNAAENRLPEIK